LLCWAENHLFLLFQALNILLLPAALLVLEELAAVVVLVDC
jgi:hypothetical protein